MRHNPLRPNAPGGTRTPNLLIRSQFRAGRILSSTRGILQVTDAERPKADSKSHNFAHSALAFLARLGAKNRTPRLSPHVRQAERDRELTLINTCLRSGATRLLG
jgi:hypothetical protein